MVWSRTEGREWLGKESENMRMKRERDKRDGTGDKEEGEAIMFIWRAKSWEEEESEEKWDMW